MLKRLFIAIIFCLMPLSVFAAETRGLKVIAKDPASDQSGEVQLYNKSYAVIIGIDRYQNLPADRQLAYAVYDAKGVESVLRKNFRFDRIISLYNQDATRQRIMELLTDELPAQMGENDSLFVFWAGHGNQEKSRTGGDIGYLIPSDGNPAKFSSNISMTQLKDDISRKIPAKHVFYVMDACYGGLLTDTRAVDKQSRRDLAYLKEITKEQVRQVLTAGGKGQEVLDGGPKGHSVFTGRLIEALEAAGDFITANEIQAILKEKVYGDAKGRGHIQTPAFGALSGSGDFVFIPNIQQQVVDTKAEIEKMEREQAELEASEAAAIRANDAYKRQEAALARKSVEARLKAAQLKEQQFANEASKRAAEEQERQQLAVQKGEEDKKLARLKSDVEKKRKQVQTTGRADTIEVAVAEIKRLSAAIADIEAAYEKELVITRQQVTARYAGKLAALKSEKQDEFESKSEFSARVDKLSAELNGQQETELAALVPATAAVAETAPLKAAIRTLAAKEFTVGADVIAVELGRYDADKQSFSVSLTGKSELVKLAMNGSIPLPKDRAKIFKQQYSAGAVRPVVVVQAGSGETVKVALANDADNSSLLLEDDEFMTEVERKERILYSDPQTGLQWVRNGNIAGKGMAWGDAVAWAKELKYAGYSDWRLPTKDELAAVSKLGGSSPSKWFNGNGFNGVQADFYWSSSTSANYTDNAWFVNMLYGYVNYYNKSNYNYVWPVRGGQ